MWSYLKDNFWVFLFGINYALVIVFSILILLKNKNPVKTLSFLFALAVFPFLGLLVYYFFGQDYRKYKIFEKKYLLDNAKINEWRSKFTIDEEEREDFEEEFGDGIFKIYKLLKKNDKAVLTFDNDIDILVNGEEKYAELRKDLNKAKHHIHVEYFALWDDELGKEILNLLCSKAESGVSVRVIYDDVGSTISSKTKKKLTKSGVAHYPFMPVIFSNHTSKINYRNHRKIVVIDGLIGYVGGINMQMKYDNSFNNERFWRDTHLRIQGGGVGSLQATFLLGWNFASKKELEIEQELFPKKRPAALKPKAIQIAASGPDSDWANIMEAIFCATTMAEDRIYITSPYFIPNDPILTALTTAARSGIDVRVMIPYESDSWAAQYATDSYIAQCLRSGIRIYRYTKGFLHAKSTVIDSMFSTIGTTNIDYRSFSINFEVNAMIYDQEINQNMAEIFLNDLNDCEEVDLERWEERSIFRKLKESFGRLWAPLL